MFTLGARGLVVENGDKMVLCPQIGYPNCNYVNIKHIIRWCRFWWWIQYVGALLLFWRSLSQLNLPFYLGLTALLRLFAFQAFVYDHSVAFTAFYPGSNNVRTAPVITPNFPGSCILMSCLRKCREQIGRSTRWSTELIVGSYKKTISTFNKLFHPQDENENTVGQIWLVMASISSDSNCSLFNHDKINVKLMYKIVYHGLFNFAHYYPKPGFRV